MIHIIAIDRIEIGERRREDMGDLAGLAESIQKYGLLHPIVIAEGKLVAGARRLTACRDILEWATIPAQNFGDLTEEEIREIELEENLRRKDLTPYERAKTTADLAKAAKIAALTRFVCHCGERFDREVWHCSICDHHWQIHIEECRNCHEEERPALSRELPAKPAHRPPEPGSERDIEMRTGLPGRTVRDAQQHVETADQFPVFQSPAWKQYHVLEAREVLSKLPEDERKAAVDVISLPATPPKDALKILHNIEKMPPETRADIFEKFKSPDTRDQSWAVTTAAAVAAEPDPRIIRLERAIDEVKRCARMFTGDPANEMLAQIAGQLRQSVQFIERLHAEREAK